MYYHAVSAHLKASSCPIRCDLASLISRSRRSNVESTQSLLALPSSAVLSAFYKNTSVILTLCVCVSLLLQLQLQLVLCQLYWILTDQLLNTESNGMKDISAVIILI